MTQAVILVGGQGTRLRPLTCNLPKPMVPVLTLPFLEHVIRNLKEHKITDIILAQHYLAESIHTYFGDGSKFGVKLTYVMEESPRGTAGAIKNVEQYLKGTFFVLNGDIFANRNFTDMLKTHRKNKAKATIALTPVEDPTIYGVVETAADNRVKRFLEKPKKEEVTTNYINAGTYILSRDILAKIQAGAKVSIERETFPQLLAEGAPVYGYPSTDYWMDTGTTEKYMQLHRDLLAGKCEGYRFADDLMAGVKIKIHNSVVGTGKVIVGNNCFIAAGVVLNGPVVIGNNCAISTDTVISDTVIWDNTEVGSSANLRSCVIANDCLIPDNMSLNGVIMGDHIKPKPGGKIAAGARLFPAGCEETTP
ncbi:MAG: NDP-sugar synthase [Dehalococcoidales bacterium]|nr:NDP-sugar synthase [Dehalococcoidales bacterium]